MDNLCKDCKHSVRDFTDRMLRTYDFAKCSIAPYKNNSPNIYYCQTERMPFIGACGPDGLNFDQKPPSTLTKFFKIFKRN